MPSAYDDFVEALKRLKWLSTWAVGGSMIIPLAAYQAGVSAPWPPQGVVFITAICQLIAAIFSFQFFSTAAKRVVSKALLLALVAMLSTGAAYMLAYSALTFEGGPAKELLVKGLTCSEDALSLKQYESRCPLLNGPLIAAAEHPEELWTPISITLSRMILLLLWLALSCSMTFALVTFVAFQSRIAGRFR